jgi:dATP pyrophosphohydrolase
MVGTMNLRHDMIFVYVARPDGSGVSHEFLQLRRAPGMEVSGSWAAVSGRIEPGEVAWKAALRELREETGLAPAEFYRLDCAGEFYTTVDDSLWIAPVFFALVAADANVVLNEEHQEFRWLGRKHAAALFTWPGDRRAVREICDEILDDGPAREFLRIEL